MTCDRLRELAPEIALDVADGEERAQALRHLSECPDCRRLVEQLSEVADELLVLPAPMDPPVGFESRVIARLRPEQKPERQLRRIALRVAPALAAAAVTAAVLVSMYSDDREVADRYRDTLERADGRYFGAQPLVDPAGQRAGVAFGYEGDPSWVLVTVDRPFRRRVTAAQLVTETRDTIPLASFRLDPANGSWGGAIPVALGEVDSIRLLGQRPGEVIEAQLGGK
ncbi:MAG TPA: hypothetical protein VHH72_05345 [Solirubrobacterales bacterium]|jgi:hypothetical protein|nr:hypothetical protein [Solirubrobacterales bacterium]